MLFYGTFHAVIAEFSICSFRQYSPQGLKYTLSGHLEKMFIDPCLLDGDYVTGFYQLELLFSCLHGRKTYNCHGYIFFLINLIHKWEGKKTALPTRGLVTF